LRGAGMREGGAGWSNGQFWGWGLGGLVGGLLGCAGLDFVTATGVPEAILLQTLVSGTFGAVGAFIGGAGGYGLSYLFDDPDPRMNSDFKSPFLFGMIFVLLISSVLGFASLTFARSAPEAHLRWVLAIGLIAGLVAAGLKGVLNNLRSEINQISDSSTKDYPEDYPDPKKKM
jgi:Flp pilus assembly pilin Flp